MTTTETIKQRTYAITSDPADLAARVDAHLEKQRANRAGLQVNRSGWIREAMEEKLAREQVVPEPQVPPEPQIPTAANEPKTAELPAAVPARKSPWADKPAEQDLPEQDAPEPADEDPADAKRRAESAARAARRAKAREAKADKSEDKSEDKFVIPKPLVKPLWVHASGRLKANYGGREVPRGYTNGLGTYHHPRKVPTILAEATELGIPEEALRNAKLLRDKGTPDRHGFLRTEKLIVEVWDALVAGQDPAPLWKKWMPAKR